ncbi:MAG: helix-hairpin-helix domain-containing protein [Bacilli bacterium]|nr:helix-hairpin-helix domain-containing protein [Bacilli bacterium]MDY6363230.1 helix-hairpin-helix domain-containing protein [Bacilli bacterium]
MVKIIIGIIALTFVGILVFKAIDPTQESAGGNAPTQLVSDDSKKISCRISGEVSRPGTYKCDINATLGDLIEIAAGETSNADGLAYDTSYVLQQGLEFYIPPKYKTDSVCVTDPIVKFNVNTASEEEMKEVGGIGSAIAKAIVTYRSGGNTFKRIEDIKNVSGIGNATFEKLKNIIRLRDE